MARKRKRQRAPRGGGSVFRVDDPARWRSPWRAQVNGRSRYFADEGSARAWAAEELARLSAPEPAPIPLLSEALAEWLESRHYTRGGTQATYATRAVLALSALPDVPITQIGLREVMAMDAVLRQDYAAETCEHVLTLLRAVCKRQALFGVVTGPNPVEVYREAVTSRARGGRPERQRVALDAYQVRVLLANMDGYLRPFVAWLAVLGLRVSELRGLRWANVRADSILIAEQRTHRTPHTPSEPKTPTSHRTIPLPPALLALAGPRGDGTDLVFANVAGGPVYDETLRDQLDRALDAANRERVLLPRFRVHDLRHSAADGWLRMGANEYQVQHLLGHAPTTMTQHYARPAVAELRPFVVAWAGEALKSGGDMAQIRG